MADLDRKCLHLDTKINELLCAFFYALFFNLVSFHSHEMFGLSNLRAVINTVKYCNVMNAGYLKAVYYYIIPDNAM